VIEIVVYYPKFGFDSCTVQRVCRNVSVGVGSRYCFMYNMYVFTKKKYLCIYLYIYSLSRIYNTSLTSAYFRLNNRKWECLYYLRYFLNVFQIKQSAGWSSGLRSRLRNHRSQVQIPVVSKGFCDESLHLLTSYGCLYVLLSI
jgi:hypothetical protein